MAIVSGCGHVLTFSYSFLESSLRFFPSSEDCPKLTLVLMDAELEWSGTGPPALKQSGAWLLASLRQSFLNGSLTRLIDPDSILRNKIVEFVGKGDLGLASGKSQMAPMTGSGLRNKFLRMKLRLSPVFFC
jgi:hypothetical protein